MKDLSDMLDPKTALTAGESMNAGNTVTNDDGHKVAMAGPGSEPVNPAPKPVPHDSPGMEIPSPTSYTKKVN
jgi:hypothetical protein